MPDIILNLLQVLDGNILKLKSILHYWHELKQYYTIYNFDQLDLPPIVRLERQGGGNDAVAKAADLLSKAKFPVILSGAGVVIGGAIEATKNLQKN